MILPTAAISVAALLSAAMLFGSFPNGGLGLPQNYHGGQSVNPYAAMAAATSAAAGHAVRSDGRAARISAVVCASSKPSVSCGSAAAAALSAASILQPSAASGAAPDGATPAAGGRGPARSYQ